MNLPKILLTIGMWLACRKYHPTFGIPGTEIQGTTFPEQLEDLGRGWEWWPSVLWQLIWTWIVSFFFLIHIPRRDALVTYTDICRLRLY
jgi:ribose/xylose/arabinose/galactoside ABC-type transport system permease subunit